jgi:hypothetical protein
MDNIFLFIGNHFDKEIFDLSTRIVQIIWSSAELLLVFAALRLISMAHRQLGMASIKMRWFLFWIIVAANPVVIYIAPMQSHDKLMLVNFLLLVVSAILEWKIWLGIFRKFFSLETREK